MKQAKLDKLKSSLTSSLKANTVRQRQAVEEMAKLQAEKKKKEEEKKKNLVEELKKKAIEDKKKEAERMR